MIPAESALLAHEATWTPDIDPFSGAYAETAQTLRVAYWRALWASIGMDEEKIERIVRIQEERL